MRYKDDLKDIGKLFACVALTMALMTGCQRNISGSYLASDNSAVVWLQVVRTPDNHLTGQLATNVLKPDGNIEQNSITISGAIDGDNVTIQGSQFLGLESFVLSGTLNGNVLTLTGAQSIPLTFTRSTSDEFQARVAELNARSRSIIQAKAAAQARLQAEQAEAQARFQAQQEATQARMQADEAQRNFINAIDQIIGKMQRFGSEADVHLARFPGAEKRYQAITTRISQYVARERDLAGNPNASVARSQLSVAATQTSFLTDQMHYQTQSLESSLQTNVKPLGDDLDALEQRCGEPSSGGGSLSTDQIQARNAACSRLSDAGTPFRQKFNAMASGLAHLEQVYQDEHGKQQQLLQTAEKLR